LGGIDALNLRSAMTLFHRAAPDEAVFSRVLEWFFGGAPDPGHGPAARGQVRGERRWGRSAPASGPPDLPDPDRSPAPRVQRRRLMSER